MPLPDLSRDWLALTLGTLRTDYGWSQKGDLGIWMDECRLNVAAGLQEIGDDPRVQSAIVRFAANAAAAAQNLSAIG